MSGLLSLLDDVAMIARLASTQFDDVAAQAAKASSKAAGLIIDDAAVTPKYVTGLPAARELPIIWKIAKSSFFNKLIILLPVALLLQAFAPWVITPILMLGGAYLSYEGAEKIWHWLTPHDAHAKELADANIDPEHLEEQRVKGAIKTDFILSAEIMTIALSTIESDNWITQAIILAIVAIGMTTAVYGTVAALVKADDLGLRLQTTSRTAAFRSLGRVIVQSMPGVLTVLSTVGTLAMLWVGGSIIVHGLHDFGVHSLYDAIKYSAAYVSESVAFATGFLNWFVTAFLDGLIGLALGLLLIPIVSTAGRWGLLPGAKAKDTH
ncbi:MAG: DUF808 domain-containing protein [Pseudomonadota bacterium]